MFVHGTETIEISKFHPNQISSCVEGDTNIHLMHYVKMDWLNCPDSAAQKFESRECTTDFSVFTLNKSWTWRSRCIIFFKTSNNTSTYLLLRISLHSALPAITAVPINRLDNRYLSCKERSIWVKGEGIKCRLEARIRWLPINNTITFQLYLLRREYPPRPYFIAGEAASRNRSMLFLKYFLRWWNLLNVVLQQAWK